jgi:hypothetical protein
VIHHTQITIGTGHDSTCTAFADAYAHVEEKVVDICDLSGTYDWLTFDDKGRKSFRSLLRRVA